MEHFFDTPCMCRKVSLQVFVEFSIGDVDAAIRDVSEGWAMFRAVTVDEEPWDVVGLHPCFATFKQNEFQKILAIFIALSETQNKY